MLTRRIAAVKKVSYQGNLLWRNNCGASHESRLVVQGFSSNIPTATPPASPPSPSPSTKSSHDIRENIHQKIAGRSRFYKHVGYGPAPDAPGMVRLDSSSQLIISFTVQNNFGWENFEDPSKESVICLSRLCDCLEVHFFHSVVTKGNVSCDGRSGMGYSS
jgi:hypothetical protein